MSVHPNNVGDEVLRQIFRKSFMTMEGSEYRSAPDGCCEYHPGIIVAARDVLGVLRLVEPDHTSPFGCRPTPHLIHHLIEVMWKNQFVSSKTFSHNKCQNRNDRKLLEELVKASGAPELWGHEGDLCDLLVTLYLAHWDEAGDLVPTKALHAQYQYAAACKGG
jgi:hypothetical protein